MIEKGVSGKRSRLTLFLIVVIVILAIVLIYAFIIRPSYNGFVTKLQNQGAINAASTILYQINQTGYISLGNNQALIAYPSNTFIQLCNNYYTSMIAASASSTNTSNKS